ncbi:MAG: hypothetical protein JSR69_22745 [Proteobacteria bacterium]|nr:hypothetical protein [Pseudomonadota bacterium]
MAQAEAAPDVPLKEHLTFQFVTQEKDGQHWVQLWQCRYCKMPYSGYYSAVQQRFTAKTRNGDVDLWQGCPNCNSGTDVSKRQGGPSPVSPSPSPSAGKQKLYAPASAWPNADNAVSARLRSMEIKTQQDLNAIEAMLVPDDNMRERLKGYGAVNKKNSTGLTDAQALFTQMIEEEVHRQRSGNKELQASVFIEKYKNAARQKLEDNPADRLDLLRILLETNHKGLWKTAQDSGFLGGAERHLGWAFRSVLLKACLLACDTDGNAASPREYCDIVSDRLVNLILEDYQRFWGHKEATDIVAWHEVISLRQHADEPMHFYFERASQVCKAFNNKGLKGAKDKLVISNDFINLIIKSGMQPPLRNQHHPPIGNRAIDFVDNPDDRATWTALDSRIRPNVLPAPDNNKNSAAARTAADLKAFEELFNDKPQEQKGGGKKERGGGKRQSAPSSPASSKADADTEGSDNNAVSAPSNGGRQYRCWACEGEHAYPQCTKKNPAKDVEKFKIYAAAKYEFSPAELNALVMPTNMDDLVTFFKANIGRKRRKAGKKSEK